MLFSLIINFLRSVGVKVEGPHHTESTSTQVKSDISCRLYRVNSMGMHKLNFLRSLHTVERSLVNP